MHDDDKILVKNPTKFTHEMRLGLALGDLSDFNQRAKRSASPPG